MECITPEQLDSLLGGKGFYVVSNASLRRTTLRLRDEFGTKQARVEGRPPSQANRLVHFAEAANRWLPDEKGRVLWIDHWEDAFPSTHALLAAARAGLGETRTITEAPGHLFNAYPFHERDQLKISAEQSRQTGLLVGLMSLVMIEGWDGWLVAEDGIDRIEFWEGHLFFYSSDSQRLKAASGLLDEFGCSRDLT